MLPCTLSRSMVAFSSVQEEDREEERRRPSEALPVNDGGPDSSYSPFQVHICWKVLSEERMEPPIQTEYLRSGGATTLIFIVEGAKAVSSLVIRSPMPANMVVPPLKTTLAYKSLRISTSHFPM